MNQSEEKDENNTSAEPVPKSRGPIVYRKFQELFLVFFVFSLFGHYIEVAWAVIKHVAFGSTWYPKIADLVPLAAPYGLGAVALILLVWPVFDKYKKHPFKVLIISSIVTGAVEFLCAALLVLLHGRNYYWNYSNMPFNLFGYIHLSGCLAFGIVSLAFLYFIYPNWRKAYDKLTNKSVSFVFWLLFIVYAIDLTLVCIREFWR